MPQPRWLQRLRSLWAAVLAHPVVNLPLGATCAGIVCAAVGPVRGLLVNELAPLQWLWLGLSWVGAAAAPIATMQIGECGCCGWGCQQSSTHFPAVLGCSVGTLASVGWLHVGQPAGLR